MPIITTIATFIAGILLAIGGIGVSGNLAGGSGTINQLSQFKSTSTPYSAITTNVAGKNIYIPESTGTSSAWYADTLCLTGDSCITNWSAGSSPLTTKGDVYTYSTADARLPVGTNGQVLSASSTALTGLAWSASGSGSQTPWTSNIDGAGYNLTNVGTATGTSAIFDTYTGAWQGTAINTTYILDDTVGFVDVAHTDILAGNPALAAGQCFWASSGVICEGSTADTYETLLTFTNPTADITLTAPAVTGTLALLTSAMTGTFDGNNFGGGAIGQGDILYGSAAGTISELAKDANATRYISNTGTTNNPAWAQVNLANGVTGLLLNANVASSTEYLADTTYTASGTLMNLTSTAFSVNAGTLTDTKYCIYSAGVGFVCNSEGGAGVALADSPTWTGQHTFTATTTMATTTITTLTVTGTTTSAYASITSGISLMGEYFTNFTNYVRSLFTGGSHVTITTGSIAVDDDFLLNTGDVGTGVYDFGGATSVEIPNGTAPVVDATGECAIDTTDGTLICYDGTNAVVIGDDIHQTNFTIYADASWDNEVVPIWISPKDMAITIVEVKSVTYGTTPSLDWQIEERAWGSATTTGTAIIDGTETTTDSGNATTTFANAGIATNAHIVFTTGATAETGTVDLIQGVIYYRKNIE